MNAAMRFIATVALVWMVLVGAIAAPSLPPSILAPTSIASNTIADGNTPTFSSLVRGTREVIDFGSAGSRQRIHLADATGALNVGTGGPWIVNTTTRSTHIRESTRGQGVLVNVQSVTSVTVNGEVFTFVDASGVPDYVVVPTQAEIDELNARPTASTDFVGGMTSATASVAIAFGQNIGYNSSRDNCPVTGGSGYWPPGPACPLDTSKQGFFPESPRPATQNCNTTLAAQGYMVNGTSIYNWDDGQSFKDEDVWHNLAPVAEQFDVDICGGHATPAGDYHHHYHSQCLADLLGDNGDAHSPVYGYAADGYALYGPWESSAQLAVSSWKVRDYSAASSTGCGADGARTCILVDQLDVSKGTVSASAGPSTSESVTTQSRKNILAAAGFYHEDHYWDSTLTALGSPYLDRFNGHSDATRGYHYHVTVTSNNGTLNPYFPFTVGTQFYGELRDNALVACQDFSFNAGALVPAINLLLFDD